MAAFVVFIREKTRGQSEMGAYTPKASASRSSHPITIHAAYGRQEVVEGPVVAGVVIVSFPSFEEAKAWYDSPAYREAREHRLGGGRAPRRHRRRGVTLRQCLRT